MATIVKLGEMSTTEANRVYEFDFANDLLTGATITAAAGVHTPPSGSAGTCTASFTGTLVYVALDAVAVLGTHKIEAKATVDNTGSLPTETLSILGWFEVKY